MFWNYRKCHEWLSGNNFQKYAKLIDMVVQSLENLEGKIWKSQEINSGQGKYGTGKPKIILKWYFVIGNNASSYQNIHKAYIESKTAAQ